MKIRLENVKHSQSEKAGIQSHKRVFNLATNLMNAIIDSPVPVIAKVNGMAVAGGCQLVAQCDIAVCTEKTQFSTPGINFGIFCSTPGIALARAVNRATCLHMLLTGLPISSKEAKESGLVTKICTEAELDKEVDSLCDSIKQKSRSVVELGKRFYYKQINEDVKKAYDLGSAVMVENLSLEDGKEGINSFMEKRKPQWSHVRNK